MIKIIIMIKDIAIIRRILRKEILHIRIIITYYHYQKKLLLISWEIITTIIIICYYYHKNFVLRYKIFYKKNLNTFYIYLIVII